MSSSPEHLVLPAEPRAVRVQQGSAAEVLEVMLEERMAERERVAADAARAELASQLERVVEAFATEQAVVQDELARAAACLGVEVARAILRTELDADRYELEGVVRESLSKATEGRGEARVHLSPTDAERLADMRLRAGTELVPDSAVAVGEVRVETDLGLVVRDPDECLDRVREALLEELSR